MDPFEQMHAQMNAQMRRMQQEMMAGMPMAGMPSSDPFMQGYSAQQPPPQAHMSGGVQIEEVEDERPTAPGTQQPIVEEPDNPQQAAAARQQHQQRQHDAQMRPQQQHQQQRWAQDQRHQQMQQQMQQMTPFGFPSDGMFGQMMGMGFPSFPTMAGPSWASSSYSSYSYSSSSGGPNGTTYQETTTSRRGPGGITEESRTVRDGRTGEERMKLTRGLGDRQRTLEQQRQNGEDVQRTEHLQGFRTAAEAQQFDSEWQSRAAGGLMPPGFGDMPSRGGQQARIQAPNLGFSSPAALNSAIDDVNGQSDRRRSRPHPHALSGSHPSCQGGYQRDYYDSRHRQF